MRTPFRYVGAALCAALLLLAPAAPAQPALAPNGVTLALDGGRWLRVGFCGEATARVTLSPVEVFSARPSLVVAACPPPAGVEVTDAGDTLVVRTAAAQVRVHRRDGGLAFADGAGRIVLRGAAPDAASFTPVEDDGEAAWSVRQQFHLTSGESLYGLGEYQDGVMDWRGERVRLVQANTMAAIPSLVSTAGWGLVWDQTSATVFDDTGAAMALSSDVADALDYYVTVGAAPRDALAGYRRLTGRAPLFARWAYGYWQSKERYQSADELLGTAAAFRQRRFPLDNLVQDWNYWPDERHFSGMVWDGLRFPDVPALTRALHDDYHLQFMVSVWPAVGVDSDVHAALDSAGLLFPVPHWSPARVYDAYSPEGREIYWRYARRALTDKGVDAWWMDGSEPEFQSTDDRYLTEAAIRANGRNALGTMRRYLNPYSLAHSEGIYRHLRAAAPEKRPFILTRSAFAGQQRAGAALWSGDIWASWQTFRNQIAAGLNVGAAGIPYWNSDIGGFITQPRFPDGLEDPAYRELYVRWFQFGAFSPIFRSHGTNIAREPWRFGAPGSAEYDALLAATRLRYRLLPYLYSVAYSVYAEDAPFMEALPLAFPADPSLRREGGAYLFGPALLVSPVTRPMTAAPALVQEFIPTRNVRGREGAPALEQAFFYGTDLARPATTRPSEIFNLTWRGSLPPQVQDSAYSVRYTGEIVTEEAGRYTFVLSTNSGTRLALGGKVLLDEWDVAASDAPSDSLGLWEAGTPRTRRVEVALPARTAVPVQLEYRQARPNEAGITLEWITPARRGGVLWPGHTWPTRLPAGTPWVDFWTGRTRPGGTTDTAAAPLGQMPLYVRAGTVLPLGPDLQYTSEKPADPVELRVYPGADGQFTLFEDTGDGNGYETGRDFATIPFRWDDAGRLLTIGARAGSFDGMLGTRTFRVVLVQPGRGVGIAPTARPDREVTYDGGALTVTF